MRPIYYLIIAITAIFMLKNNMTTETIVSTWNDETDSWEEISRTEEESGWNLIYDENEVWINDTPLNKTLRDGMSDLGTLIRCIWNA